MTYQQTALTTQQTPHSEVEADERAARGAGLIATDWFAMAAGIVLCLLISYTFGYKRIFWEDEMLGWMLLHDPSWKHMLWAWNHGADGGGITFYATCRAWFALFGASEVSFRMYSAVCFGLGFCVTWLTARKFYALRFVAPSLFAAWFLSPPLVQHFAEGRFYGLLMFAVSLVVWFSLVGSVRLQRSPWLYVCAFALNGVLVTSHVLGIVYSGTVLAGLVLADRVQGRWRPALYAVAAASWLLLVPERRAIWATTQVGKPYFWTTPPTLGRFLGAYCEFSGGIAALLGLLVLLVMISRRVWKAGLLDRGFAWLRRCIQTQSSVVLLLAATFSLPVVLAIHSYIGTSLFTNRYLMPLAIPEALLLCQLFAMIRWDRLVPAAGRKWEKASLRTASAVYAVLVLSYVFGHLIHFPINSLDYTQELTARLPRGVPVVCEDAWVFTQLIGKQHASGVNYTYLLDWDDATSKSSPRLEVTQYHLMENWKTVGYFSGSIQKRAQFLAKYPRFLVLRAPAPPSPTGPVIGNPLVDRFQHTAGYQVVPYDVAPPGGIQIWQVCRGTCAGGVDQAAAGDRPPATSGKP